ncbi:MAG: endonuclease MutS2 [Ruminococcaceae bacterium]|nr:endonuclease MutS2 [Oscillospiraceae bacterium]
MKNIQRAKKILEYDKILSLLAECCPTEGSAEEALRLTPSDDGEEVLLLNRQTDEASRILALKGMPPFGSVKDVHPSLERASKGAMLNTSELLNIASLLRSARTVKEYDGEGNANGRSSVLQVNFDRLMPDAQLENDIGRAIVSEDMIADEASPTLADIRRRIRRTNAKIRENLQKYITSPSYNRFLQENIITMRNGRYVVPVRAEYKNEIKGLVHDTSSSGATMFIEPLSVVEANNELRVLEGNEQKEIERILYVLSSKCAERSDVLMLDYVNLTALALIFGKAQLAFRMDAAMPRIHTGNRKTIKLKNARHPLIDSEKVVPISVSLGGEFDTLVITGPNTGGKTVTLKTLGLLSMMAQTGLLLPADAASEISVFSRFLADIGDEQSIELSLSTFSSHMVNIIDIVAQADESSLVLFDELCAGTDPTEGASLAVAILEHIRAKGSLCAATTHYSELKVYALENEGVLNASCEFDIETLRPTYRLILGTPGKSNAFDISLKLGLCSNIIEAAKRNLSAEDKRFESVIEKLNVSRMEMEKEKAELEQMKEEFARYREQAEKRIRERTEFAEKEAEKNRALAVRTLEGARAASEYVMGELEKVKKERDSEKLAQALSEGKKNIRNRLNVADDEVNPAVDWQIDPDYKLPRTPIVGDTVYVVNVGKQGKVEKNLDRNGKLTVRIGNMTARIELKNVMLVEEDPKAKKKQPQQKKPRSTGGLPQKEISSFSASLDIRGCTGEEGWDAVDKYIDDAMLAGIGSVTIVHGKGTGALRRILWDYFKKDPRVAAYRSGAYGEGDFGVTVLELK